MTELDYIRAGARARAKELLVTISNDVRSIVEIGVLPTPNEVLELKHTVDELLHAIETFNKS